MAKASERTVTLDDLVEADEAAEALGVGPETFKKWRQRFPDLPAPVKVLSRGTGLWLRSELVQWREAGGGPKRGTGRTPESAPKP